MTKHCGRCNSDKPLDEFPQNHSWCKNCNREYKVERRLAIKEGRRVVKKRYPSKPVIPIRDIVVPGLSSSLIGDTSELLFAAYAQAKGWNVLWPFSNGLPYDCAIEIPDAGNILRVQVKSVEFRYTHRSIKKSPILDLRRRKNPDGSHRLYNTNDFDRIAAVSPTRVWLIPWPLPHGESSGVVLNSSYDKYIIYEQNT